MAGFRRLAAVQHAAHDSCGRSVDAEARRRRDPCFHVVVGEGTGREPGSVHCSSRVGVGTGQDTGARARRRTHPRQSDHSRSNRHRPCQTARRDQRQETGCDAGRGQAAGDQRDSSGPLRRDCRIRPCGGVPAIGRRRLPDWSQRAGRRRPDPQHRVSVLRKALLGVSTNAWVRDRAMRTGFVKRSVPRFMPGETLDEALGAASELQKQGITTILTKLGENLTGVEEAEDVTHHYLEVLDKVAAAGLDAQVSIKPTQLGLDFDRRLCERNLDRLIARAEERNNVSWIDMESSPYVDRTLDLYRRARAGSARVGVALQAYLYRTANDLESLLPLGCAI